MNRDRRKILASIFADTAKYSLTAGIIGAIVSGKISVPIAIVFGLTAIIFILSAYFVTPKDKEE